MKTWMKTTLAATVIALGTAAAGTALARGDCGDRPHDRPAMERMSPADMQARMSQHRDLQIARLELSLALTPAQRPAWDAFKDSVIARSNEFSDRMHERMQDDGPSMNAVERLKRMEEASQQRQAATSAMRKSVERLYATLSDAQKTVFDAEFARFGPRGGHDRHAMGPHDGDDRGRGHGDGPREPKRY